MHTGSCACGGVRYEIDGDLAPIQFCHCSVCRKSNGAPFASNIPVEAANFRLLSGRALLREFESSPGKTRTFCGTCGGPLHSRTIALPEEADLAQVTAKLKDGELRVRVGRKVVAGPRRVEVVTD